MSQLVLIKQTNLATSMATLVLTLLINGYAQAATVKIIDGPTSAKTAIDMHNNKALINFEYEGCGEPDPNKVRFKLNCHDRKVGTRGASYKTAEATASYYDPTESNCATKIKKNLPMDFDINAIFSHFQKEYPDCQPVAIMFNDQFKNEKFREKTDGRVCQLPWTKVAMPGDPAAGVPRFGTEESTVAALEVKENMFRFGNDTYFRYDVENKRWDARYLERDSSGKVVREHKPANFDFATPVPIMFGRGGKAHLAATVVLNKDGTAIVRSHNKVFDSQSQLHGEKPFNDIIDEAAGAIKIDMNNRKGLVGQTVVTAFDKDGQHIRTMELVGRNLYGNQVGLSLKNNPADFNWCAQEHCFRSGVTQDHLCQAKAKAVDMTQGANGNICLSCLGQTPGICETTEAKSVPLEPGKPDRWEAYMQAITSGALASSLGVQMTNGCAKGVAPYPYETATPVAPVEGTTTTTNAEAQPEEDAPEDYIKF